MTFRKSFCDIHGQNSSLSKLTSFLVLTECWTELVYTLVSCTVVFILPWNSKHGFAEKVIRLQIFRPPLFVKQTINCLHQAPFWAIPCFEVVEKQSIYRTVWATMSKIAVSVNLRRLVKALSGRHFGQGCRKNIYKCNYFPGKYNFLI